MDKSTKCKWCQFTYGLNINIITRSSVQRITIGRIQVARQRHAVVSRIVVWLRHSSATTAAAHYTAHFLWQRHHARIVQRVVSRQTRRVVLLLFDRVRDARAATSTARVAQRQFVRYAVIRGARRNLHRIRTNVRRLCVRRQHHRAATAVLLTLHVDDDAAALRVAQMVVRVLNGIVRAGRRVHSLLVLLLQRFYLEPRLVALIVDAGEYHHIQDEQTAANEDGHAQRRRVGRIAGRLEAGHRVGGCRIRRRRRGEGGVRVVVDVRVADGVVAGWNAVG